MLEIEYIPLKTPDGLVAGYARVRGGYAQAYLRKPLSGAILFFTDNGSAAGAVGARIPVGAPVSAVALHENGSLRCWGVSRTAAVQPEELRRRVQALSRKSAVKERPGAPDTAEKPDLHAASVPRENRSATMPDAAGASAGKARSVAPDTAEGANPRAKPAPREKPPLPEGMLDEIVEGMPPYSADNAVLAALNRLRRTMEEAEPPAKQDAPSAQSAPEKAEPQAKQDAQPPAQRTAEKAGPQGKKAAAAPAWIPDDAGERSALAERAQRVFRRIDPPIPAMPAHGEPGAGRPSAPEPEIETLKHPETVGPAGLETPEDWARETEALLAAARPAAAPQSVPNPFPHIFPGAVFVRDGINGALAGTWRHGAVTEEISAVPGPYSAQPPAALPGYTRYIRARSGGYWVKVTE